MYKQLQDQTIAFIGSGMMGGAIIHALAENNELPKDQIIASDPHPKRRRDLAEKYGIRTMDDNPAAVRDATIVVLAVKPQVLPTVMAELKGRIPAGAFVFSIIAGIPMITIQNGLEHSAVIRTMPNTPAQIGEGITAWTASPDITEEQLVYARAILRTMGLESFFKREDALDMATAISGTGPTYAFLLMEALLDAAVHMGMSRQEARPLVMQTVIGSAQFAFQSERHMAELRNMVTSPGGTSAEAIYQMEKGGMRTILSKAVWAAFKKARLLGERAQKQQTSKAEDK